MFDSMIFYRSWMEAVAELDSITQGEVFRAIVIYGMNNEVPDDLSPVAKAMFIMAKPNIDANNAKRVKNAENGAKGGRPKAKENPNETQTKPKQNPNETQTEPKQKPNGLMVNGLMDNGLMVNDVINPRPKARDDRFDTFWKSYPRKQKKKDAERAWRKINPDSDLSDRIIKAVDAWKRSDQWTKDGGQYIPYPSTWLNGCQWEDEIPKARAPANSFSNFPQRPRTQTEYEDIERALLGVRRHA